MDKLKLLNTNGIRYSIALVIVVGIIITTPKVLHVDDVTWALISGIVCTELDIDQVRKMILLRIIATIIGVIIAALILTIFGSDYGVFILGIIVITLVCHYVIPLEKNWKLAHATGVLVLLSGLQHHSIEFAKAIAIKRSLEVISGSLIAGIIAYILGKQWRIKTPLH